MESDLDTVARLLRIVDLYLKPCAQDRAALEVEFAAVLAFAPASPAPETRTAETPARSMLRTLREVIHADPEVIAAAERACVEMERAYEKRTAAPRCPTCGLFMRVLTDDHRWAICDACRAAHFTDARAPETRTGEGAKTEPRRTVAGDGWHRPSRACGSPLLHYDRAPDRCHCRCERCSPDARAPSPREGTP